MGMLIMGKSSGALSRATEHGEHTAQACCWDCSLQSGEQGSCCSHYVLLSGAQVHTHTHTHTKKQINKTSDVDVIAKQSESVTRSFGSSWP